MVILGIDYGRSKLGVAISEGGFAEPLVVVKTVSVSQAVEKIGRIVQEEGVEKLVVGVSEGSMAEEEEQFVQKLQGELKVPVETWDETLTTQDAHELSIEAGVSRRKRRNLEDAFAAAIMLQSFLDSTR
ncbi:MAG: Holliday junction resolvase RuvX [Candidatus Blackburnbacteria bacterium]|nr:Holliday junction resolvase RuvX [Candidatus Blackburnbacteria bacterium]